MWLRVTSIYDFILYIARNTDCVPVERVSILFIKKVYNKV